MVKAILLAQRGKYPKQPFKAVATTAWLKFFEVHSQPCDVAFWEIEADSATVKLSKRQSDLDEDSPAWDGWDPIAILVDGIAELLNHQPRSTHYGLRASFQNWVTLGVLESFNSPKVARRFAKWIGNNNHFAIATTPEDDGLSRSEMILIWSNDSRFSASAILERQAAAKKRTPKFKVRKKVIRKRK